MTPPSRVEEISSAFLEAKILLAAAELRLFDALAGEGDTAEAAARRTGGSLRGVRILLDALVAMGILRKDGEVYRNREEHEADLLDGSPSHYAAMLRHRNLMFRQWASLEDIVRGRPSATEPSSRPNLDERAANENFIRAMYAVTRGLAPSVVDRIDLRGVRTVADLGGGPGVYLEEMARRAPGLELYLADLPLTLEVARKILAGSELAGRIRLVAWDIYRDPPPDVLPALDLALLSQVLHGESPEANRDLLARVATRLAPGGRIVVHERIVDPGRTSPYDAAIFAVNMLAMTPGGNVCTEEEIHGWGREAGLVPEPGERLSPRSYLVRLRRPL